VGIDQQFTSVGGASSLSSVYSYKIARHARYCTSNHYRKKRRPNTNLTKGEDTNGDREQHDRIMSNKNSKGRNRRRRNKRKSR